MNGSREAVSACSRVTSSRIDAQFISLFVICSMGHSLGERPSWETHSCDRTAARLPTADRPGARALAWAPGRVADLGPLRAFRFDAGMVWSGHQLSPSHGRD